MNTSRLSELFSRPKQSIEARVREKRSELGTEGWNAAVACAESLLNEWQRTNGKEPAYTPETLAFAQLQKSVSDAYQMANRLDLYTIDALHQALMTEDIQSSGLAGRMACEGEQGRKLGIAELGGRLLPCLHYQGCSAFLEIVVVPYGTHSRQVLGEPQARSYVSAETARASASNISTKFDTHYSVAETSRAPTTELRRSGKKPEVYVCGTAGGTDVVVIHQTIDTPLRAEFNAWVREIMVDSLRAMYR